MINNTKIISLFDTSILSENSREKLNQFQINTNKIHTLNPYLEELLKKMLIAFTKEINVNLIAPINVTKFRNILISFNKLFNYAYAPDSKFEKDVMQMNQVISFNLVISGDIIEIHFLKEELAKSIGLVSSLLHALHTFCHLFPYNYNGLIIYVCLDYNTRDLELPQHYHSYQDIFDHLHKISAAFNVSGVTYSDKKEIILTKSEEMIKLMYHELVHYVGLDHILSTANTNYGLAITKPTLNLFEAYAEFMSVLLNSAYQSIHLSYLKKLNPKYLYKKILCTELDYSLYLSANILKFYGYNDKTYLEFFNNGSNNNNNSDKKYNPVLVWEYILLRTQLLIHLDTVVNLVGPTNFFANENNKHDIIGIMKINNDLINELFFFMQHTKPIKNISYTMIDFNWDLF